MIWLLSKIAAIPTKAKIMAALIALLLFACFMAYRAGGKAVVQKVTESTVEALETVMGANEAAETQRGIDTDRIDQQRDNAHDAIDKAPPSKPSPATVAHGCERLRKAGRSEASLPIECRNG